MSLHSRMIQLLIDVNFLEHVPIVSVGGGGNGILMTGNQELLKHGEM